MDVEEQRVSEDVVRNPLGPEPGDASPSRGSTSAEAFQFMSPWLREDAEVVALTSLASRYSPFDPDTALALFGRELCPWPEAAVGVDVLVKRLEELVPRLVDSGDPVLVALADVDAVSVALRGGAAERRGVVDASLWQRLVWRCVEDALPELRRRALLHGQCYWGLGRNGSPAARIVRSSVRKAPSPSRARATSRWASSTTRRRRSGRRVCGVARRARRAASTALASTRASPGSTASRRRSSGPSTAAASAS